MNHYSSLKDVTDFTDVKTAPSQHHAASGMGATSSFFRGAVIAASLLFGANISAEWTPGLNEGRLPYKSGSFEVGKMPDVLSTVQYPVCADTKSAWPTAKGASGIVVYSGQIYLEAGAYWFAEAADAGTRLEIGGTVVLNDKQWSSPALGRFYAEESGWYDFDLRFLDDGGGYFVSATGWLDLTPRAAFVWKAGDENGSQLPADNKVATAYSVPGNAPGATLENCLFRCDDGLGFADSVIPAQSSAVPVEYSPATAVSGLAEGDTVQFTSATSYESGDSTWRANLTGYTVSNVVEGAFVHRETVADPSGSFTYTHNGIAAFVTWLWNIQYRLTTSAADGGSVSIAPGWFNSGSQVTLSATHPTLPFAYWIGDVDADLAQNSTITVTMDKARNLTAVFGKSEIHVATTGSDTTGDGSAANPFKTPAAAIAIAGGDTRIIIAPGTYTVSAEMAVDKPITISGSGDSPADVVINGKDSFRIFRLDNADAKIENITIAKGRVNGSSAAKTVNGGNVLITGAGGMVSNCIITAAQHIYFSRGAGVYIESENGVVADCTISNCYLTDGNALQGTAFGITAGRIERCLVTGNIFRTYASPNYAHGVGYIEGGVVENCTIAGNIHGRNVLYIRGGEVRNCVIARNYTYRTPVSGQIDITDSLRATVFTDSVWDGGALSDTLPAGEVRFVDFAAGDFRLAAGSAGAFEDRADWGYTDSSVHEAAAQEPASVTVEPGDDLRMALRRVADGGTVILKRGTHKVSSEPLRLVRDVTLRGETGNPSDVIVTKGTPAPAGPLVATASGGVTVEGLTFCDNKYNGNLTSSGIHMIYGGGTVSNCVLRKLGAANNINGGAALRIEGDGAHVTRCVISNNVNHANTGTGGAIYISGNSLLDNCLIADCNNDTWNSPTSSHWGKDTPGAIYQKAGVIANCTIVNCKAPRVAVAKTAGGIIRDTVIYGNERTNTSFPEAETIGTGSGLGNWANIVSDITTVGRDGTLATAGNIGFVDAEGGDWRLSPRSVARDAGGKFPAEGVSAIDLAGNPRRVSPRVDAGCYERPGAPATKLAIW